MPYCGKIFIYILVILISIAIIPGIPPYLTFSVIKTDPAISLDGPLKENNILDHAEKLYDGHISSPESIAFKSDDEIFTSTRDGSIVRIWGKNWENSEVITRIGPKCAGYWEEHTCGRALGIRFDKSGRLLVADSYLGLFAVDVKTGKQERLFDPLVPIEGHTALVFDDIDIDSNGNIYWSDASYVSNLADNLLSFFTDPSGRLIKFDPKTKTNTVLVSDLLFANGVQLSPDESFVLVSETGKSRVLRYWLKGPKEGKTDIFVTGLPGYPDNVRARKNGGYYVSLVALRLPDRFSIFDFVFKHPMLRRFIARIEVGVKSLADTVNGFIPNTFCAKVSHNMLNLAVMSIFEVKKAIVVEIDESGKIIGSLQGSGIGQVSQTDQVGDSLFFGSPYNNYLGRLDISHLKSSKSQKKVSSGGKDEL